MKLVYLFGRGRAEGNASMTELLGGKGANLAEMTNIGLPVPAGFTITTRVCRHFHEHDRQYPPGLKSQATKAIRRMERAMGARFGDQDKPLLVSVRSGARRSMPGMMETVLNVGLCSQTIPGLILQSRDPRFVYDAYRRLITMYADVAMEKGAGIEPREGLGVRGQLEQLLNAMKLLRGYRSDAELSETDLKELCARYQDKVREVLGRDFPDDAQEQLWGAIGAVFASWQGKRAAAYRRIEGIPDDWGTAVNVQAMVFGNMGADSATGVAFSRNPATGENHFYGEWLPNAQGEDVVAGIRTPNPLSEASKEILKIGTLPFSPRKPVVSLFSGSNPTLERVMPGNYRELEACRRKLEKHYRDMQDIEFTIQHGRLWILQCRVGKRSAAAALSTALDMLAEGLIDRNEAVLRLAPQQLDELLHRIVDPEAERQHKPLTQGLPAGPGGASGPIVFSAQDAVEASKQGHNVILVREETNPEDIEGIRAAAGILTARGGMTSHAALVARGWGKCCVVGCSDCQVDAQNRRLTIRDQVFRPGDDLTLNGTRGMVYAGSLPLIDASENPRLARFMKLVDSVRRLKVRANADNPDDALKARQFGAEGIGLFRTEHMFYGKNSEAPLFYLRKMIVSRTEAERRAALNELYPYIKKDIKATLEVMEGLPVTIRLLDPPLHEFVPHQEDERNRLADSLHISPDDLRRRARELHEVNPMMGHRGVRLGITHPEITETWTRAIFEAAAELIQAGKQVKPEIMIPVVVTVKELIHQKTIVDRVYQDVCARYGLKRIDYLYGTMIEVPRAALKAQSIAALAEFFSYGTNDLTQMGFGFSRDDVASFMPDYLKQGILKHDPLQVLDQEGLGELIKIGIKLGRKTRPNLKIGICGEHGGEPLSVEYCHRIGMDYVSCSPFRVPIARLAAAQAALKSTQAAKTPRAKRKKPQMNTDKHR